MVRKRPERLSRGRMHRPPVDGTPTADRRTMAIVVTALACAVLAATLFSAPATAGTPTITLFGSRSAGWGLTNTSLTSPGPPLSVELGDNVTLVLNATDGRTHTWYLDYNNDSAPSAGEPISPSFPVGGGGGSALSWNFTAKQNGSFRYRSSRGPDGAMWGNLTVRPAGGGAPLLDLNPSFLIIVGVGAIIVAVVAIAAWSWRRTKAPPAPPPPEQT